MAKTLSNAAPRELAHGTPENAKAFRQLVCTMGSSLLKDWVGEDRAAEATGRIASALSSAAACAKKPQDFYNATPTSIANCVALSALTNIMPSTGAGSLAYLIPRAPRKGEQPQLQYQLSHRGLNALASRSGQIMVAITVSHKDQIGFTQDGEVIVQHIDFDNPPSTFGELRGVIVIVRRIDSALVIARGWVPKRTIEKRRAESDSYQYAVRETWAQKTDPWHKWPVEMSIKTAMHYAIGRGWCVIDDTTSIRALAADVSGSMVVDAVSVTPHQETQISGSRTERIASHMAEQSSVPGMDEEQPHGDSDPAADDNVIDSTAEEHAKEQPEATAEPEKPAEAKQKNGTKTNAAKRAKSSPIPKSLKEYADTINVCSSAKAVMQCWTVNIEQASPSRPLEEFELAMDLRDKRLVALGENPDEFVANYKSQRDAAAGQKSLL